MDFVLGYVESAVNDQSCLDMLYVTSTKKQFRLVYFPSKRIIRRLFVAWPTLLDFAGCNTPKKGSAGSTAHFLFGIIGNRHFFLGFGVCLVWWASYSSSFCPMTA
jgi:hypothetical protein